MLPANEPGREHHKEPGMDGAAEKPPREPFKRSGSARGVAMGTRFGAAAPRRRGGETVAIEMPKLAAYPNYKAHLSAGRDTHHPSHQTRTGRAAALKEAPPPTAPFRSISSESAGQTAAVPTPPLSLRPGPPPPRDQGGAGAAESAALLATSPEAPPLPKSRSD